MGDQVVYLNICPLKKTFPRTMVEAAQKCAKEDESIRTGVQAKYRKGESERRKKIETYGVLKSYFFLFNVNGSFSI